METKIHQKRVSEFCQKIKSKNWYHYTDCGNFEQYKTSKNKYIHNLKDLVDEYMTTKVQNQNRRTKRGALNFVGEVSKILFGTLTQSDAKRYNEHIQEVEKEQEEFLHLSKEQMTIVKTTIASVNSTLQKVNKNENILREGLKKLYNYNTGRINKIEEEMTNINLINEQFRLIQKGIDESLHSFEILMTHLSTLNREYCNHS
jgi:chromosome segregation ATPase